MNQLKHEIKIRAIQNETRVGKYNWKAKKNEGNGQRVEEEEDKEENRSGEIGKG